MKLSVKWLAGLAVLALAVVAVVGSTSSTKAAEGRIFVANEWSKITNENPAPSGYTTRGTVYSTYSTATRLIQPNSDLVRVVVTDTGRDTLTGVTVSSGDIAVDNDSNGPGGDDNILTVAAGQQVTIFLVGHDGSPIAGADSTIDILVGGVSQISNGVLQVVTRFNGGGGADPWIRVQRNSGTGNLTLSAVTYQTSQQDQVTVKVKTDLEPNGVTVLALETGLSTARFVGYVKLVPTTVTSTPSSAPGDQDAQVRTNVGPVVLEYQDSDNVVRSTQVVVDTSAPTVSVTGPAHGSATQNRRPTFSGAISETGSGLKIDQIAVIVDTSNDASNSNPAILTNGTNGSSVTTLPISTSGALDGDLSFSFSQAPNVDIPTFSGTPDHIVDWGVRVSDLAGNLGFSDSNPTSTVGTGAGNITGGYQLHTVKIDQTIPSFVAGSGKTGLAVDAAGAEVSSRRSVRVVFNDQVQNVQASDFVLTLSNGTTAVPSSVTVRNNPSGFANQGVVYLTFPFDLASNATGTVALQDTILDLAGNSTATGSVSVSDGIKPVLTVTLLNGSGTGTGSEGPNRLTNERIDVQVSSDEALSSAPTVTVFDLNTSSPDTPQTPTALSQGTNIWRATYVAPGGANGGNRAVVVAGTDTAANTEEVGDDETASFRLDLGLPDPVLTVGGGSNTTSQVRPFITIDFGAAGETSTVTVSEVLLDGTDVTSSLVASSNRTRFFIAPTSDLSLGSHTVTIPIGEAVDAAGNENSGAIAITFSVVQRETFNIEIFAGWNAISFTSDPVDPDVNSVFPNVGHDAVLQFDANVPGMWRIATRDAVSGQLTTTSQNGLSSVISTRGYWVHSNNFEPVEVELVGETLPSDGNVPTIPTIQTVSGFNAIPVVDTSRKQTQGPAGLPLQRTIPSGTEQVTVGSYLSSLNYGRVYVYSPETLNFIALANNTVVETGDLLFVEVLGTPTPFIP